MNNFGLSSMQLVPVIAVILYACPSVVSVASLLLEQVERYCDFLFPFAWFIITLLTAAMMGCLGIVIATIVILLDIGVNAVANILFSRFSSGINKRTRVRD